jgi:tetratricopeptide (TPR) repeat protein
LQILEPLRDDQNNGRAYREAAILYLDMGRRLETAHSGSPEFWYRKALAAVQRGERVDLVFDRNYQELNARRGRPRITAMSSAFYLTMGRIYMQLKQPGPALVAFEKGRALESDPELLEETAAAYRQAGDAHSAALALDEAYIVDSNRPVLPKLVELYRQIDPAGCAVAGGAINPDCPLVHADICAASTNIENNYVRRGQAFEAGAVHKRAVEYLGCK